MLPINSVSVSLRVHTLMVDESFVTRPYEQYMVGIEESACDIDLMITPYRTSLATTRDPTDAGGEPGPLSGDETERAMQQNGQPSNEHLPVRVRMRSIEAHSVEILKASRSYDMPPTSLKPSTRMRKTWTKHGRCCERCLTHLIPACH